MQVERFARFADRVEGIVVTRSPYTRVARYVLRLDATGRPIRYELRTTRGDGSPETAPTANGSLTLVGDTIQREVTIDGAPATQRFAAPGPVMPGPMLPYLGVTYLTYEFAFRDARLRASTEGQSTIRLVTMLARSVSVPETRAWFVGPDSVELDYFGVARSGYRLDREGRLLRADWRATTYRYQVTRVPALDVEPLTAAWAAADSRGAAMGALSPRDSSRGSVGATEVVVTYGRPAKRGRRVWGEVVLPDRVWRLGADLATEVRFSTDVDLGTAPIPAGSYSLWMLTTATGEGALIVNRRTRIFGTQHDPTQDLVRVPLRRDVGQPVVERLTIETREGRLWIRWDDVAWSVEVRPR